MREISRKAPPVIEASGVRASGSAEKHGDDVEDPGRIIRQGMLVILLFFGGLGLWAVFTLLYFALKKRYASFALFFLFFAAFFTAPLWSK